MKKSIIVLLFAVCIIFAGCSDVGTVGLIQNSNGTIIEYYSIPYAESELLATNLVTKEQSEQIKALAKTKLDAFFDEKINNYIAQVEASVEYTDEEKEALKKGVTSANSLDSQNGSIEIDLSTGEINRVITCIQYALYFDNSVCYNEFKNSTALLKEPKEVITEKSLFTTTTKVVKDPVFDNNARETIKLGEYVSEQIDEVVISVLATDVTDPDSIQTATELWSGIKTTLGYNNASAQFIYCYVVPTARLKSNAHEVRVKDGYYYHLWEVKANNSELGDDAVHFEYWTTRANKAVWYAFAMGGAGIVILVTYLVSKKKDKKQVEEFIEEIKE